ncbi:MAG: HD domain-containing protein [Thermodesulfovibrionales bacterium]
MRQAVDVEGILRRYYAPDSLAYSVLKEHGAMVARKALDVAGIVAHLSPDRLFLEEAALLHDIGIILTHAPGIGCNGDKDYICHGYLGRELLEKEGLPEHGLVCERHIGLGLRAGDIEGHGLPLPRRDMLPVTLEEKIICYADKFYSKNIGSLDREKTVDKVRQEVGRFGEDGLRRFEELHKLFSR